MVVFLKSGIQARVLRQIVAPTNEHIQPSSISSIRISKFCFKKLCILLQCCALLDERKVKGFGYLITNENRCDGVQRGRLGWPTKRQSHSAFCRPICNNHRSHGWEKIKPRKLGRQQHLREKLEGRT